MDEKSLVELGQRFADVRGVSLWWVGLKVANDGKYFVRLREGKTCTLRSARSVVQRLSDIWPDGLEWPADIPRPPPRCRDERGFAAAGRGTRPLSRFPSPARQTRNRVGKG